jgi:tetratricopeptide (TPR) repeat protein
MHQTEIGALTHEEVAPISEAGSLEDFTPEYHSVVYQKGAMVFHMLRGVMGDAAFFKTLQMMTQQDAWKTITTAGFQSLAEAASHQQLTYFFAQWVSSTGVPQFTDSWDIYRVGNHYQAVGTIHQDLDIFRMPVEIRVYSEGRPPIDTRIEMEGTRANFAVNTLTRPTNILIDPESQILKMDNHLKVEVAIARGDQLREEQAYLEAIKQYRKVTEIDKNNSLAHYRMGQIYFLLRNYNAAADEMRAALNGDREPNWIPVWAHLTLGEIFDTTGQRDRAINEYQKALQTHNNAQGALDLANRYIQKPYTQPPSNG